MLYAIRRSLMKMFRELVVYHNRSLEFRAKVITLMIASNHEICECEEKALFRVAHEIYVDDENRAALLIDTVKEYYNKIVTNNGLDFEHLVLSVARDCREVKRFAEKIDIDELSRFTECIDEEDEDEKIFQKRILEFLEELKEEHGAV